MSDNASPTTSNIQSIQQPINDTTVSSKTECRARLDDTLRRKFRFRVDSAGNLYNFERRWIRRDQDWVWTQCYQELPSGRLRGYLDSGFVGAVMGNLRAGQAMIEIEPPSGKINLAGTILDIQTGNTVRALPDNWPSPIMIPVEFNPEATCPAWDRFLAAVVLPDAVEFIRSVIASTLVADSFGQRLIWLAGLGGNGKGTLLRAIAELLGESNVVAMSFKALAIDRFAAAQLYGKLLAVDGDSSLAQIKASESLKQVTAHDLMNAQEKYGRPFSFVPFAKPIVAANGLPNSLDISQGFFDRPLIVNMESRWRDAGGERRQTDILGELATEREGFIQSCIGLLRKLFQTGRYEIPESVALATQEFRTNSHPVGAFAEEWLEFGPDFTVSEVELRQRQHEWALENQIRRANREEIAAWLRSEKKVTWFSPGTKEDRRTKNYRGVRIRS